jgi:RimJ/RimL family protein N-acetyltransferase
LTNLLETERLFIRHFATSDANFVLALLNSEGWLKFIGDRNIRSLYDATQFISEKIQPNYVKDGYGMFVVLDKNSGELLGMCGLVNREYLPTPDIGFAFLPQYQGKGYALEAAKAVLDYAIAKHSLHKLSAIVLATNLQSIKLLAKLGFGYNKTIIPPNSTESLLLYCNYK